MMKRDPMDYMDYIGALPSFLENDMWRRFLPKSIRFVLTFVLIIILLLTVYIPAMLVLGIWQVWQDFE